MVATQVWCLEEKCGEISNLPYQPNEFNFRQRSLGKPSKHLTVTFRALGSSNGCGCTLYAETSHTTLFAWMLLTLGVSMDVAFFAV